MWVIKRTNDGAYFAGEDEEEVWVFTHQPLLAQQFPDRDPIRLVNGEKYEEAPDVGHQAHQ
jgi:hypothetical protein